jgi:Zn-dependent metalloprotease
MKTFTLLILFLTTFQLANSQFKPYLEQFKDKAQSANAQEFNLTTEPIPQDPANEDRSISTTRKWSPIFQSIGNTIAEIEIVRNSEGIPIFIYGLPNEIKNNKYQDKQKKEDYTFAYLNAIKNILKINDSKVEFQVANTQIDDLGFTHIRLQQTYKGIEVYKGELIVHFNTSDIYASNGHVYPTPKLENITPNINQEQAIDIIKFAIAEKTNVKTLNAFERQILGHEPLELTLMVYHTENKINEVHLAWIAEFVPNLTHRFKVVVDAHSGEILDQFDQVCKIHHHHSNEHISPIEAPFDRAATARATDLKGVVRNINTYEIGGGYYLLDAAKTMFNRARSKMPNEPVGAIWTINGQNNSPANDDFEVVHHFSQNNVWNNPTAISAHYNAEVAYNYFRNTFNRNSIDGRGGNIISLINITDENKAGFDNAFWNGSAIFYGNGRVAFEPLAKGLDVAGHEMSHGVIQHTANLEYRNESGALNESFADVFGVMIDRTNWKIGEDIVRRNVFRSGAMRDMENPNNGGSSLQDNGWQPANTSQQYFGNEDNGGVHINSGIPNRAFYLIATGTSKEKAEQIYYRALSSYLTRSSQFVNARLAVVQAATDFHGANSPEVNIVNQAFDAVGIRVSSGGGGSTPSPGNCNLPPNPGEEFIILTDANNSALYLARPNGQLVQNPLIRDGVLSKPSATDNGNLVVYVGSDKRLKYIDFTRNVTDVLQNETIWRNAAISKDGLRVAAIRGDLETGNGLTAEIIVFDLVTSRGVLFELTRPTTAQGVSTGDVLFADALEWDYDGEFLIFDSFNSIKSNFGANIEYWDISVLKAWDKRTNNFGDGTIFPLFPGLDAGESIGNPSLAKNDACVMVFDYLVEDNQGNSSYGIIGYNYETNKINLIKQNQNLGFPSYSNKDDNILFNDYDLFGGVYLALQPLAIDRITATGQVRRIIQGGNKGTWFATANRVFTNVKQVTENEINVYPTLVQSELTIELPDYQTDMQCSILDIFGKVVKTLLINGQVQKVTLDELPMGTYFLQFQGKGASITKKVIKY